MISFDIGRTASSKGRKGGSTYGVSLLAARLVGAIRDHRQRLELARLDTATLRDIGLERTDVDRLLMQPFWQPGDWHSLEQIRKVARNRRPWSDHSEICHSWSRK